MQPHDQTRHQRPRTLLDVMALAQTDVCSDEAHFLAQLRAVVAAVETPTDRLRARYRAWPSGPALVYAKYRDQ